MRRFLADLGVGCESVIVRIAGNGPLRRRLLDMGITPGSRIRVERYAPLGDPMEVAVKGSLLALRLSEARRIEVEDP